MEFIIKEVEDLLIELEGRKPAHGYLNMYYEGRQPLTWLSPESREALGDRLTHMSSNIPRLIVNTVAERLRPIGVSLNGKPSPVLWAAWRKANLDELAAVAHREALATREAYVWVDHTATGPTVTVESGTQTITAHDPATHATVAGLKRWESKTHSHVVYFTPQERIYLTAPGPGVTAGFTVVRRDPNPFGVVPIVPLVNSDRLDHGRSEFEDAIPLVDGLNKSLADMLVGSEAYARPRRWATGLELEEEEILDELGNPTGQFRTVNPFDRESVRMLINEDSNGKFGSLPAGDLNSYETSVRVLMSQISAVSGLPGHMLGVLNSQPPSADGVRAAEASLIAKAEQKQRTFGRAWEQVFQLMYASLHNAPVGVHTIEVRWNDPATRSQAQEADAVVKLVQSGILPLTYALTKLGYSESEIQTITEMKATEQAHNALADVTARLELAESLTGSMSRPTALAAAGLMAAADKDLQTK